MVFAVLEVSRLPRHDRKVKDVSAGNALTEAVSKFRKQGFYVTKG